MQVDPNEKPFGTPLPDKTVIEISSPVNHPKRPIETMSDSKKERKKQTVEYMQTVKSLLSKNEYLEFKNCIYSYGRKEFKIQALVDKISIIFASISEKTLLRNVWNGLKSFMDVKYHFLVDKQINLINE
jgi:hypothetical protein